MTSVPDTTGESAPAPAVSVIVCSHNGAETIARTLASLQRQSLPGERYEVIVVDDGSTDGTEEVAKSFGAQVVRFDQSIGLAAARNAGVRASRAEIVAFTDDDCEADPDWLPALLEAFSESDAGGVGAVPRYTTPSSWATSRRTSGSSHSAPSCWTRACPAAWCCTYTER